MKNLYTRTKLIILLLVINTFVFGQDVDTVVFPDNFQSDADYQRFLNKTLFFNQTLVVTDNSSWQKYGSIKLSSIRVLIPNDTLHYSNTQYPIVVDENRKNSIFLDDGSAVEYPNPLPFSDGNGTLRTGSRINNLKATLSQMPWGYVLTPIEPNNIVFYGNPRPDSVEITNNYNLRICSFNLEYYITENFDGNFGPANTTEAQKQHDKIIEALIRIDADIYCLIEIQSGQNAIQKICNALNSRAGYNKYAFINDGSTAYRTYTKVGFIYRTEKVLPNGNLENVNNLSSTLNRKKIQCFKLIDNNEKFILSLNHFKSKSGNGTGNNADLGNGQGSFNGDRMLEASAITSAIRTYSQSCRDSDVLILGDMNAYSQEDPMIYLYSNGYRNIIKEQNSKEYSFVYKGLSGCLDHALANPSMARQITGASIFHINADEPKMFGYKEPTWQNNMYRSSDHDAVIVTLNLGTFNQTPFVLDKSNVEIIKEANGSFIIKNAENSWLTIMDITGKQILHQAIRQREQNFHSALSPGIYIFIFDDMKSKQLKSYKVIF